MTAAPPHNVEAEQSVLAGILLDNRASATAFDILTPADFYLEPHRVIFRAMMEQAKGELPVDVITVTERLTQTGNLNTAGGWSGISALAGMVSTAANIEYWAGIVKDKALLRATIAEAGAIIREARDEPEDVDAFTAGNPRRLERVSLRTTAKVPPLAETVDGVIKNIQDINSGKILAGMKTGLGEIDRALNGGLRRGSMIVLAGRPSTGKSALAFQIALHCGINNKFVAFFSLEMSRDELVQRGICQLAPFDSRRIQANGLTQADLQSVRAAGDSLVMRLLHVDDQAVLTMPQITARCRRLAQDPGLDLVVIDYLQLIQPESKRNQTRENQVSEISRQVKILARQLDIPVLALSQLNRAPEERALGEPRMSDLRESGAQEQDMDCGAALYKPNQYDKSYPVEYVRLNVMKNRFGPAPWLAELSFNSAFVRFNDWIGIRGGKIA